MLEYEKRHIDVIRTLAPECVVLLKSNGMFPLEAPCEIALFGNGARRTQKGGTGSGDVNVRAFSTIEQGLKRAGFTATSTAWLDAYDTIRTQAEDRFNRSIKDDIARRGVPAILDAIGRVMQEPDYEIPLNGFGTAAVYVLSRQSGEGSDRRSVPGDFLLSDAETRDILLLHAKYPRFMLVLNTGGVVDLSPVVGQVDNVMLLSQLGMTTGDTFADLLLGKAYPSGKLTATWEQASGYCPIGDFGEKDDTRYREGIYVGYRYFDRFGKKPMFPFGYGLGYTGFGITFLAISHAQNTVSIEAELKNIGSHPGKEVVQLYASAPGKRTDVPFQILVAFAKSHEMRPGQSERLLLRFDATQLASYEERSACMVIEKGDHVLRMGSDSGSTAPVAIVHLDEDAFGPALAHVGGVPDFTDARPDRKAPCDLPTDLPVIRIRNVRFPETKRHVVSSEATRLAERLTDRELMTLCIGLYHADGSQSVIGSSGVSVAGSAGETVSMPDRSIPGMVMADGPAGLRLSRRYGIDGRGVFSIAEPDEIEKAKALIPEPYLSALGFGRAAPEGRNGEISEQNCSAIPIATAVAQSFDPSVAERFGDLVGEEMERFGVRIWLAPGMNIHRHVLCGRNFEYYSEDPLLSGKIASGITRGVQKHPTCGVTLKHFACNNQETNRYRSNSVVSERALREIYLKGFEICTKEADPVAVMTSYNLLNGVHTAHREDLIETVLRGEWGFRGFVMSDWVSTKIGGDHKYPPISASASMKAGNDIMMPGNKDHLAEMIAAMNDEPAAYPINRDILVRNASRVIEATWRLNKKAQREESL